MLPPLIIAARSFHHGCATRARLVEAEDRLVVGLQERRIRGGRGEPLGA